MKDKPLETALVGGITTKCDERIEFFGETDTVSSYIMELIHHLNDQDLVDALKDIVKELSNIMAIVAGVKKEFEKEKILKILELIKKYKSSGIVLKEFVLPGQTLLSAKIHIVRTHVRTCERRYAKVYEKYGGQENIFEYLNKLSTLFYELALYYEKSGN